MSSIYISGVRSSGHRVKPNMAANGGPNLRQSQSPYAVFQFTCIVKIIFLSRGGELVSKLDKQDLVGLARDILENNYFEFNGNTYRQRMGTAIGTRFAPKKTFCEYFHVKIRKKDVK